jgi:hypothetical protein
MQEFRIIALRIAALALFLCAGLSPLRAELRDGFEAERAAAVKELLAGLEAHVEWCSSKKIWIERNRTLEAILLIDPGNLSAKRGLGWQQVADGVWEPPREPKPAKNFDPGALKEVPKRFADAIRPWRDHLVALLETYKNELTPAQRDSVYAEILAVDPDDAFVRASRGEERGGKGWVLAETVRAKARRAEIRGIVKQAYADVPAPKDFLPTANDMVFQVDWKNCVATGRVRVLSTGAREEALRVASVLHASRDVFQAVFATVTDLGGDFTLYLLCDAASKKTFLANFPGLSAAQRSFYEQVEGTGLQGSNSGAWWAPSAERRLDGVTRHALGAMFQAEFGLTVECAWAWEGLGIYLTREMIGSRLTWYIVPVPDNQSSSVKRVGPDWMKKLLTPGTNWMNEGYRLLRAGQAPTLIATLNRPLNKMTPQDLFLSYVTAGYLLEGQAALLPGMLRALGGKGKPGQKPAQVWPSALSMDLAVFAPRLERWLGERR